MAHSDGRNLLDLEYFNNLYAQRHEIYDRMTDEGITGHQVMLRNAENNPELFKKVYPKVYEGVDAYPSPKMIASMLLSVIQTVRVVGNPQDLPTAYSISYRPVCDMIAHRMPSYFVTRDLALAAMKTDFKDEVDFLDLKLPFESGVMYFPKGTLVHPDHGLCDWIGWGRCPAQQDYTVPGYNSRPIAAPTNSMAFFTAAHTDQSLPWLHFILTDGPNGVRRFRVPQIVKQAPHLRQVTAMDDDLAQTDDDFLNVMVKLCLNLFLIEQCRPTLLRHGSLRKRVVKKQRTTEFWTPHILGHNYKIKRISHSEGDGDGLRRRGYWVQGHDKQQAYGPKHSLLKPIWIDPYWVDGLPD